MCIFDKLETHLQTHFHFDSFRTGQKEIIQDVLKGHDVIGVLPTGTGKSLCYQLPAKLMNGSTVVISPLVSLMTDQVKHLRANQYKEVVALTSFMEFKERQQTLRKLSAYKLIYISPELLQSPEVLHYFKQIDVSLFVIDEAHCISQWGHEFRPDYLRLERVTKIFNNPPILALSATATKEVQSDIMASLKRPNMIKHIYPMDRKNIALCVNEVEDDQEKIDEISKLLSRYHVPTLIYFSSRRSTEVVTDRILQLLPEKRTAFYHGGMDQSDRIAVQQQFMNDQLDIICCTNAFGMGIDKNNIRLIIHYHFPTQLESYIQEIGRAGRDGSSSVSVLFYAKNDELLPRKLIQSEIPTEENLLFVFQQLQQMTDNEMNFPMSEENIANTFQVNEVQWRFIHFQLEKNGIIKNNQIIYDKHVWEQAYKKIIDFRNRRFMLKQAKLIDMIHWMKEQECLRKHLYKGFQASYRKPNFQCCSNCGFSYSAWKPIEVQAEDRSFVGWKQKLQHLLLIGDDHAAE